VLSSRDRADPLYRTLAATFMQRVNSYLHERNQPPYVLNLDPAVMHLPFDANIDIRDTVDYPEVMKQCVPLLLRSVLEETAPRSRLAPRSLAGTTSAQTAAS